MKIDMNALRNLIREELVKERFNSILNEEKMSNSEQIQTLKGGAAELSKLVRDIHAGNFMKLMGALAQASSDDPGQYKRVQKKMAALLAVDLEEEPEEEAGEEGAAEATEEEKEEQMKKLEL